MDVIYKLGKCTVHFIFLSFHCILQCNALLVFFPLEHIAWQQEEVPCGGPFMSEAIIFEWTSAPPPAKHKHLTIERNMPKKTEIQDSPWQYVSAVLINLSILSSSSLSVNIPLSLCVPAFVNNPCLLPLFVTLSLYLSLSFFLSLHLAHCATNQLASQLCLSHPVLFCWLNWHIMFRSHVYFRIFTSF